MTSLQEVEISEPSKRSGLATASLVCSLIVCCPLTTILGPILGVIAFFGLRKNPEVKGKGFAIAGILIGLISSVLWVMASSFISNIVVDFLNKSTQVTANVIQTGTDGEYDSCRSYFITEYSGLSDDDIKSFVDELQTRYGKFDSVVLSMEQHSQELKSTQNEAVIPIQIVFETTDIYAESILQVVTQSEFEFEFKLMCLKIFDPKNGDLVFPPDSPCE